MNEILPNKKFIKKVIYEIIIQSIDKVVPEEHIKDFTEWIEFYAIKNGTGRHSEYYSYNENYSDDISVVFIVKSITNQK